MESIDFQHRTRLVFGRGAIDRVGELSGELGGRRALVVSDPGVVAAGHCQRGINALTRAGIEVEPFYGVRENPTTREVHAGLDVALAFQPDLLVAIGGGSSMDCAKGINFLYPHGGDMREYWGIGKAHGEMLPMIAVPTTAGTGSEAQSFALISQAESHVKMACGDPRAACRVAVLDPELTLTQPPRVTALTGIDAISHALESYVTQRRNPLSVCYSRQAWRLLSRGFPRVVDDPTDIEARGETQLGAFFAGLAIETSMLGAAHALANPLTARFDVAHGQAVGLMLPWVIRHNGEEFDDWYDDLWRDLPLGTSPDHAAGECASALLADLIQDWLGRAGLDTNLDALGIAPEVLDQLADDATTQWTGTFNPRPMTRDDFRNLYHRAHSAASAR